MLHNTLKTRRRFPFLTLHEFKTATREGVITPIFSLILVALIFFIIIMFIYIFFIIILLFSFSLAHSYKFLVFCCAGVAVILHPLHILLYPGMARTRGGHSFRPRVRPSSPPPATRQSSPPTATNVVPPALIPAAPIPHRCYTRAWARDPGESSSSSSQEPQSPHI